MFSGQETIIQNSEGKWQEWIIIVLALLSLSGVYKAEDFSVLFLHLIHKEVLTKRPFNLQIS